MTTGIFKMVASFIGVQRRLVGGGVGLVGLENVASPIGFDDKEMFFVFKVDLSPNEAFKNDVDGELLLDVDDISFDADALEVAAPYGVVIFSRVSRILAAVALATTRLGPDPPS